MEENSGVHVDTEVSPTTSAVPDTRQATGIHGNVETVIVVEEVKEEDLTSYGTPESSPTKSKDVQEAVVTLTLSPEIYQSKKIVTSPNKEVHIVYINKQKTTAMSAEVKCTTPRSELVQSTPTNSGLTQKTPTKLEQAQNIPIKLVQMQMTPSHVPKTSLNSEHVQNTPNKLEAEPAISEQLQKTFPESEQVQKKTLTMEQVPEKLDVDEMQTNSDYTKKPDQMPKTPLKSDQMSKMPPQPDQVPRSPPKPVQVSKTPPKSDEVPKSPPKSDQAQKLATKSDQVPKSLPKPDQVSKSPPKSDQAQKLAPKSDQVPKSPPKSDQVSKSPRKSDQVSMSPSNLDQIPKTPSNSEQMNKITSEQVHKKSEQMLEIPTNSDEMQNTPPESEQVQKTTSVPEALKNADETVKIVGQRPKQATIKSLEQQESNDNIIDISDEEVVDDPKRVPESISEQSTKESKQTKELVKEQEQPRKTPGKLDLYKSDSHSNKLEKSSIKDKSPIKYSLEKQNTKMDCSENAEQSKESSDKVRGDKKDKKREDVVSNTSMDICEKSNDSQLETNSDISEKDHNKSISRELKSLIKSAKESKIISECTQLTSKTRKSRAAADSNNTSLNTSVEADKIQSVRRSSINSQKSNCSEKSEKASLKRSMRSQNPEFVNKVKQFLNSVTGKSQKGEEEDEIDVNKKKDSGCSSPSPKKKKTESQKPEVTEEQSRRLRSDMYCWRCHWAVEQAANDKAHPPLLCTVCPRSFHYKCISGTERNRTMTVKGWICPECMNVLHAESAETQSLAMKKLNHPRLCELLQYAWDRMVDLNGVEPFMNPVDRTAFPDYDKYVVHPMDLSLMKQNLTLRKYGSTEAFLADAQWILHNSIIFNTLQSKLTAGARALVRSCRAEMGEIEACPECYAAAHARRLTWFTDVCSTPHILLWAKLKGFPYWPAKGMSVNSQGLVDVRFFGAHDRAWVPARDCFLYCQKDPNNFKAKRLDILESMQEAEDHIRNISRKYGKFVYPAFKTPFDPTKLTEQLKMMIPTFDGEVSALVKEKLATSSPNAIKDKSRSNSKSSKSSMIDGDASESEEAKTTPPRKMADGGEIAREKDDVSTEKNTQMEIDDQSVQNKEKESSRKRRRSALEEAVITIITTSSNEKRRKLDEEKRKNDKTAESTQQSNEAENTQESGKAESTQKSIKKPEETTVSETTTKSNNNKNEKTYENSNNKGNEKEVPTTPTIDKEVHKEVPTKKVEKTQVFTTTPVKTTPKVKPTKTSTPKEKEDKTTTPKQKPAKPDKSSEIEKDKQNESILKSRKRSKSRNRSLNSSQVGKGEKTVEKKSDKDTVSNDSTEEKVKESNIPSKDKESETEKPVEKANKPNTNGTDSSKPIKDRLQFDDDTSLAVIARETAKKSFTGLPTISSVRSLSTSAQSTSTITKTTKTPKTVEVTVSAHCALNVFTPTSTDNVRNMKEAVDKLQKLRNETDKPLVGRVGVRSFARMTSPPAPPQKEKPSDTVEIEVKSEPIDFDDADRQVEKMDLMRSFHLQPVNPVTTANLRDVRINKVIVTPVARKGVTKTSEVRIRARKTFPTPKKDANEGRSELNGKNTMVYIPIQPPTTQAPIQRPTRPITINGSVNTQTVRPQAPASIANSIINTQTSPLVSVPMTTSLAIATPKPTNTIATSSHSNAICVPSVGQMPTVGQVCQVPTVGQIPTSVHTVPLITSVNGQWTFSLQPMMSVGSDGTESGPVVNGLPERSPPFIPLTPANPLALLPSTQILPSNSNISSNNNNCSSNNGDTTPAELPRLQQRPPLANPFDPSATTSAVPVPSTAGPLTAKLSQHAVKLADFFRTLLEDSLEKIDDPLAQVTILKTQLEQAKWKHKQEISELKHTHELLTTEMRVAFEKEKTRAIGEMRRVAQVELEAAVKAAKTKQWCANCSQEAQFYCCWNTSYCDYSCQRSHWSQHFAVCTQPRNAENNTNENGNALDKRLQSAPENLPRTAAAPPLTAGTKLAPARVYAHDSHPQKTSIIVSMVEDPSGNQMVKCVGTYKPPGPQQVSPLILNKHLMNNDENAAKKVMTSGGYLIVGAGNSTSLATNRRTHPVQYTYNT